MDHLYAALAVFTVFHLVPSTPLRTRLLTRLGRRWFMVLFSVISLLLFAWVWVAYILTEPSQWWWITGPETRWVSAAVMLFAVWLTVAALSGEKPILLTGERELHEPEAIRGAMRITRHPLLWSVGLWGIVHLINVPNWPSWVLFGYMTVLAIGGTLLIDRRRERLLSPPALTRLEHYTSNVPFLAILDGRSKLHRSEFRWWQLPVALLIWALILVIHIEVFHRPVLG